MLNDTTLIVKQFDKNIKDEVHIYPIADVHLGALECHEEEWAEFLSNILDDPFGYVTLGGDLINNATKSSVSNVYKETISPRVQKEMMCDYLAPLARQGRILAMVEGNHEARTSKDTDQSISYDIACKLDIEDVYRENMAFLKLNFGDPKANGNKRPAYTMMLTHGSGGGMTGASVNRLEKYGYVVDADILIMGHTHKPFVTSPSRIRIDTHNNKVSFVPFKCITSTSWLGYGDYAMRAMMPPSSCVPQIITLGTTKKYVKVTM